MRIAVRRLRSALRYCAKSGRIIWRKGLRAGRVAGTKKACGYIGIVIEREHYYAHHVAWALHYGSWPSRRSQMDHINGDRHDNRIRNLRLVTRSQNARNGNSHRDSASNFRGVSYHRKTGKWRAQISVHGHYHHLGLFAAEAEAAAAYDIAAKRIHGKFARLNFSKCSGNTRDA